MDAALSDHPTRQVLSSFSLGKLDEPSANVVSKHLEQCYDCRKHVAEMSANSFLGRVRDAQGPAMSTYGQSQTSHSTSGRVSAKAVSPPPTHTLPPGLADHPDYEIKRELGRGGMGVVYLAHNRLMGRDEVLKVMARDITERPGVLDRFVREIRAVAKLRHPNIVTAYHASRFGESVVFTMEYVDGLDLARMVKSKGPLPVGHACNFVYQAALGLQHAHEEGLVHRDIKPGNLMLSRSGNKATIKILDFGLAKASREEKLDGALTSVGQALGTPDFIAPEQIVNAPNVDIRADIYSLGGTLYHLLSGRPPFQANSLYDMYQAHMSRDADPLNLIRPEVPVELAALVAKMMAKEPEWRFQAPVEVAEALAPFFKKQSETLKGDARQNARSPEPSQDQPESEPAQQPSRSTSTQASPAIRTGESIARGAPGVRWESLIDVRDEDQPTHAERTKPADPPTAPAGAASDERSGRRPRWMWPAIAAASMLGLIALVVIVITIRGKDGDAKITARDEYLKVEGPKVVVEHEQPNEDPPATPRSNKPETREVDSERDTASVTRPPTLADSQPDLDVTPVDAGRRDTAANPSPAHVAGNVGIRAVDKPPAPVSGGLLPRTSWRGTSMVLSRSWTNNGGQPQAILVTIRTRAGNRFKAIAESCRGRHDAEGTLKNGVIAWRVPKENSSWKGKLVGNEIVGTFQGASMLGAWSGEFRLKLSEVLPPAATPNRVPSEGPARGAAVVRGGVWTVEGEELVKSGDGDGWVQFGDLDWTDYQLSFDALKTSGPDGFGGSFRSGWGNTYTLGVGGLGQKHYLHQWSGAGATGHANLIGQYPGTIQTHHWYHVRITLRGERIRVEVDTVPIFDGIDNHSLKGCVSLRFYNGSGRFRRIKVTALNGTKLWEGPPDLP